MISTTAAATRLVVSYLGNRALSPPQFLTKKLLFPCYSTLHFHRYTHSSTFSTSTSSVIDAHISVHVPESGVNLHHPWPEWVLFVDKLNSKGYLSNGGVDTPQLAHNIDYRDMNMMRNACLSFARDRLDIFQSLSRQDIQAVVEKGCPNLYRKSVNSGKKLRVYLQLDEGDVCSSCLLRGSCDRANVIPNESEAAAGTVDIVRILLAYALDSAVITGEKSPGREHIEVSARKLLLKLIELSETAPNPETSKPTAIAVNQKKKSSLLADEELSPDIELKRGDWMCPECNFMNFYRNLQCRECGEDGPRKVGHADVEMKKGDWICPDCSFMNFSRNASCLKCKAEGPKRVSADAIEMKKGDWNCPQCNFMNFYRNLQCRECGEDGPRKVSHADVEMKKGDWICPDCSFMNFSRNVRNVRCLNCKGEGPKRVSADAIEMKKGDWNCPQCQFMNFASNKKCKRCQEVRPKRELIPGDWECPSCDFLNYAKNVICRKCDGDRPNEKVETHYEDQLWRKPPPGRVA